MGLLHPKIRLPLWGAAAIIAAAFGIRAFLRGGLSLDRTDWMIVALCGAVFLAVGVMRRSRSAHPADDEADREDDHSDD